MKPHHQAWLRANPEANAKWLSARMVEGFDVHHIDGNAENNSADNLVLIYHPDHMLLHTGKRPRKPLRFLRGPKAGPGPEVLERGKVAYECALQSKRDGCERVWAKAQQEVFNRLGVRLARPATALSCAKTYAGHNGLPWPVR